MSESNVPEVLILASAFRQAFEMEPSPGNTVQSSQNPLQVHLNGFFNFQKAATNAFARLQEYQAAHKAQLAAAAKKTADEEAAKVADDAANTAISGAGGSAGLV